MIFQKVENLQKRVKVTGQQNIGMPQLKDTANQRKLFHKATVNSGAVIQAVQIKLKTPDFAIFAGSKPGLGYLTNNQATRQKRYQIKIGNILWSEFDPLLVC